MISWTEVVSALSTFGTLVVAALAAVIGFHQIKEARRLREEQAQPYVFVSVEESTVSRKFLDLVIKNVGATAAVNVRLEFRPSLRSTQYPNSAWNHELSEHTVIKDGLPYLPPGAEFRFLFEFTVDLYQKRAEYPERYDVTVTYLDSRGRVCDPATYVIDLTTRWSLLYVSPKTAEDVVHSLDKIEARLAGIQEDLAE